MLVALVIGHAVVFQLLMAYEHSHFSFASGVYWTLTTVSSLGYGDITFASDPGAVLSVLVLLCGMVLLLVVLLARFIEFVYEPSARVLCMVLLVLAPAGTVAQPLEVLVEGVTGELRSNILLVLSVQAHKGHEVLPRPSPGATSAAISELDLRRLHRRATNEIRQALKPFGYYRPLIDVSLDGEPRRWLARYKVDPGPPTLLSDVSIDMTGAGREAPELTAVLAAQALRARDVLVHARFEAAKTALYEAALGAGYLDARWSRHEVRLAPDLSTASLALVLETGPRFYFGEVTFDQDVLWPAFLQRFVRFKAGDPYDTGQLLALQFALDDSKYFSRVEIEAPREQADGEHRIPVLVETTTDFPQHYTLGAGVATDTGPRVSAGAIFSRVNRGGHRIRGDVRLSGIEKVVAARYVVPVANVATDTVTSALSLSEETVGDADTRKLGFEVSRNEEWLGFVRRLYVNLEREDFQFSRQAQQQSDLLYVGMNLLRQRSDDPRYPRRGYSVAFDVRGATEHFVSDVGFLRVDLEARWVLALTDSSRLLLHGGAGAMHTSAIDRLSTTQRFFTGGDRSVRGYGYEEIATHDADGAVVGGQYLALASVEVDHLFYKDYGLALFVDGGTAFRDRADFRLGAGIGFRWRSPIGMVRLDLAHPFNDPAQSLRIHISIGPDL